MNKEKFLMELKGYLSILENQEQEDILAEYAQHIDMKMRKGLSEEEAIRDFGSMQELAAEILEAYHVKPEFRRKGIVLKLPELSTGKAEPGVSMLKRGFGWIGKKISGAVHRIGQAFRWFGGICRAAAGWFKRPWVGRRNRVDREETDICMEETQRKRGQSGNFCNKVGHGIMSLCRWFWAFCVFWLRLVWNAGWLMFSLFCACMALIILMGVGAIPVFLVQGYPFIGIFIICVGGLLCFGSLSCGAFSMLIRKEKDKKDEEPERLDKEVCYEQTT